MEVRSLKMFHQKKKERERERERTPMSTRFGEHCILHHFFGRVTMNAIIFKSPESFAGKKLTLILIEFLKLDLDLTSKISILIIYL
jgi:hypothetical protein